MQFVNQLLQFLRQGIAAIFEFVQLIWNWSITQITAVPWDNLGNLPLWKQILLVVVGGGVLYLLYQAARQLLEAGVGALNAIATLLGAIVKTLVPVLLAGLAAAVGAYILVNVNF